MPPPPVLPPRGLFIPTRLLFDTRLPSSHKETLLMLMAITWRFENHATPLLSLPMLEQLTGKPARTLREHLRVLRTYQAVLRLQYAEAGQFIIVLADWLFCSPTGKPSDGRILPLPVKEEEELNLNSESEDSLLLLPDSLNALNPAEWQKTAKNASKNQQNNPKQMPKSRLSKTILAKLLKAGVFPALLDEIAAHAEQGKYSGKELAALLAWAQEDEQRHPAALFVSRLRAGARAPKIFFEPACQRCGKRGGHAQDCPQRYVYHG